MASSSSSSSSSSSLSLSFVMTPDVLNQLWQSYGGSGRVAFLTAFSQTSNHVFSNYSFHPSIAMDFPDCCNPSCIANSGRSTKLSFDFCEKGIMACKAALFQDYQTMDEIFTSTTPRQAKALGRKVAPFDQQLWNTHQCTIVRHVAIAKLQWKPFRDSLLATGDSTIAECTPGDWVWGTALQATDSNVWFPGRWKGLNILGWSLMEARDTARQQQQQQQQVDTTPPTPSSSPSPATTTTTASNASPSPSPSPHSVNHFANLYSFGPDAFGPLQRSNQISDATNQIPNISHLVKTIVEASFPEAINMRGERGKKPVTRMLKDIYDRGLFMHGNPDSSVNRTIIPAMRFILDKLQTLAPQDTKRISIVRDLAEACQDCQQVQARVILRHYGDFTAQNETFQSQLKYSLVRSKEAALQILITKYHSPSCDLDHTQVSPEQQRAHLWSGYVSLIGDGFGLDGVTAANGDRFLTQSLAVIRNVHRHQNHQQSAKRFRWTGSPDQNLKDAFTNELTQHLCVKEWLSCLLGDINNQSENADRILDRSCIFEWVSKNIQGDFKHRIFYDETRSDEYSDLDPKEPTQDNQYEPFLSPAVLVEMLVRAGMLVPASK